MSLFGRSGMTAGDVRAVTEVFRQISEAVAERLRGHDEEIAELRAEIKRLKDGPRMNLSAKLREKGKV